jgi:hypothetical protein
MNHTNQQNHKKIVDVSDLIWIPLHTVELFMLSHVEKRKMSVVGKSIVLRGQKVV